MRIISGTTEFYLPKRSVVAIGKFDGVHLGHQKLFQEMLAWKAQGLLAVVFTFDKSPASVFAPGSRSEELTTLQEKRLLMEKIGADVLVEFPMTVETAAMPAENFIKNVLARQLNGAVIVAGDDISFGHKGLGNRALLETMAGVLGYQVEIVEKLSAAEVLAGYDEETVVSSTLIKSFLEEGKMEAVASLCGRPYSVTGPVIHGNHLGGPVLQMPTINMPWPENKAIPPYGVYYTKTLLEGNFYVSITNVGCKPTVARDQKMLAETYLYKYEGNAYGEEAQVFFFDYQRPERKFKNLASLKEQMQRDIAQGRAWWDCHDFTAVNY